MSLLFVINKIIIIQLLILCLYKQTYSERCGLASQATRIVGGQQSRPLSWPWMALLTIRQTSIRSTSLSRCGGSLISDEWVLTAAHCVSPKTGSQISDIQITFGEYDTRRYESTEVKRHVAAVYLDSYSDSSNANDIALLKLNQKLDLKSAHNFLQPICLPTAGLQVKGDTCVATGWGANYGGGRGSDVLQEVRLPIVANNVCQWRWRSAFSPDRQLCAGYMEGGRDTCQGDSGGPLNCQIANGAYLLQGITSYGGGCAQPNSPGVYTKVSTYMPWIERTTGLKFN
ncbi:unnamed protein product, partial [Medioppia subpectinata]